MGDPGNPETHDQKTTRSHRTRTRKNMAKYITMPIRTTARAPYAEDDAVGDLRDDSYEYMGTSRFPRPHVTSSRSLFRGISQNIYGTDCHVAYKITPIGKHSEATPRMGNTAHCLYFPAFFFLLFSRFDTPRDSCSLRVFDNRERGEARGKLRGNWASLHDAP